MTATWLFESWPYAAAAVFVVGLVWRFARMRRRLPPSPYELARAVAEFGRGKLWRLSLGSLLAAHVVGLAFPRVVLAWNASPWRLYLLEGVGVTVGLVALIASARLVARYLERAPGGVSAELADSILFSLLFVAIASGVATAIAYRWASSWAAATLAPYAASLVRGQPSAVIVEHLPFLARVHVIASVTMLAVLPFSRLALLPLAVAHRAVATTAAMAERQISRAASWSRRRGGRRDRLAWLWPEGEVRWLDAAVGEGTPAPERASPRGPIKRDDCLYESGELGS